MSSPQNELCRLTATEAVLRLKRREITPLDLIDAAARRIAEVEPDINALPTPVSYTHLTLPTNREV